MSSDSVHQVRTHYKSGPGNPLYDFLARFNRAQEPDALDVLFVGGPLDGDWACLAASDLFVVAEIDDPDPEHWQQYVGLPVTSRHLGAGLNASDVPGYRGQYVQAHDDPSRRVWSPA